MSQLEERFQTGLLEIDAEHAMLLDLTEQARKLFEDENMLFKCADIRKILGGLQNYTVEHFTHEERYMEDIGFPGLEEQKAQHREFAAKLAEFTERVSQLSIGTQDAMIYDLFQYLLKWLHDHIKKEDMKYVDFGNGKIKENH